MKPSILVAGFATRHVAMSAFAAGYRVYAVDHFRDQDLSWYTADTAGFEELGDLPGAIGEMIGRHPVDYAVLTSGAESLRPGVPICGTPPDKIRRFLDKLTMQNFFGELGVPTPALSPPGVYPAMLKPREGSGGWRNRVVFTRAEQEEWEKFFEYPDFIAQEVVEGLPSSVCCVSDGIRARAVAVNEQLLRGEESAAYGFSGSITPLDHPLAPRMMDIAEKIAGASGCVGTLGVDFVLGDAPRVIEVNPRFQATLDTVERATGVNLFSLHAGACRGRIPAERPKTTGVAARKILFAERETVIRTDLSKLGPIVADIPYPGTEVGEGRAIVSVLGWGKDRAGAMGMLDKHISAVLQYMG
ncbi:putative ATP-grasp superfamily ATP-dependent carboligase [Methanolinea mesophila]|uniref:ATP-grasp domain-containing protein n=1 Tax=Methanolinea mesophila TaxID=547055 RepID=UPI001AEA72BB|nr:ATP-grasp domain-containing protein [Methanolinea mesophila]MBP1929668.1 putative ATP-grasp superfamily ATP-dependent carboligase [Methanolinea mesophila]